MLPGDVAASETAGCVIKRLLENTIAYPKEGGRSQTKSTKVGYGPRRGKAMIKSREM